MAAKQWRSGTWQHCTRSAKRRRRRAGGNVTRGVTEAYERRLWEELNALMADVVPKDASQNDAERVVLLAVLGIGDTGTEIRDLYEKVKRLARTERGYLRERMEEDNPISAVRQRLRISMEPGQRV